VAPQAEGRNGAEGGLSRLCCPAAGTTGAGEETLGMLGQLQKLAAAGASVGQGFFSVWRPVTLWPSSTG